MRLWPKRRSEPHPTDPLTDDVEVHDLSGGVSMGDDAPPAPQMRTPEGPDERAARLATDMAAIAADLDRKYGGPSADDATDATADIPPAAGADDPAGDDEWRYLDLLSEGADENNGPETHDGDATVGAGADDGETPAAPMVAPEAADVDGFDPDALPTGPMPAVGADTPDVSAGPAMFDLAPDAVGVDASDDDDEPDLYDDDLPAADVGDFHSELAVLFGPDANNAETAAPGAPTEDGHDNEDRDAVEMPGASAVAAQETEDEVVVTPHHGGFIISGPTSEPASEEAATADVAARATDMPAEAAPAEDGGAVAGPNAQADVPAVGVEIEPVVLPAMDAAQERAVAGDLAQLADEMVASVLTMKSGLLEEQEKQEAARAQIPQLVADAVAAQATRMRGDLDAHQRDLEAGVGIAAELATLHVQATDKMADVAALAERAERGLEKAEAIERTNATHEATLTTITTQARELLGEISQMHATVRGDVRTIGAQAAVAAQQRARISAAAEWAADAPDVIAAHVLARSDEVRELDTMRAGLDQTGERLEHLLADAEGRISTIEGDATAALGAASSLVEDIRASAATAAENVGQIAVRAAEDATELRDTFTEVMDATLEEMRAHADAARTAADQARAGAVSLSDGIRELVRQELRAQLAVTTSGTDAVAESAPAVADAPAANAESDAERWARLKERLKALRPRLSAEVVSDMTPERSAKVRAAIADLHGARTREELSVAVGAAERLFSDD